MNNNTLGGVATLLAGLCAFVLAGEANAGDSVGQPGDPKLANIHSDATRHYYAGADASSSVRVNAIGDTQVLYYDFLPRTPGVPKAKATVVYIHGGGYNSGYANYSSTYAQLGDFRDLGFDTLTIEYRRGWFDEGNGGVEGSLITVDEAADFEIAKDLALDDVLDAWDHFHTDVRGSVGAYGNYLVAGESAGGSLASRATLTNASLSKTVVGTIVGFGTHRDTDPLVNDIPTCIQGGLFDPIQPAYTNNLFFSPHMPMAKGLFDLYAEIDGLGGDVLMYMNVHDGHGFGAYADPSSGLAMHYAGCIDFFKAVYFGTEEPNHIEYRFDRNDPFFPGYAPGDVTDTLLEPGFIADPYEQDLDGGMSPAEIISFYGL